MNVTCFPSSFRRKDTLPVPPKASNAEWKKARWTRWTDMFNSCDRLIDKKIVCGHVPAFSANAFDNTRTSDNADVFITDGLIVVDAGTYTSKQLNVFVVTDEL